MNLKLDFKGYEKYLVYRIDNSEQYCGAHTTSVSYIFRFDNGYGASVIKNTWSYGADKDLWELGVIKFEDDEWHLNYDTEITNDVLGYLTDKEVRFILSRIKKL